MKRKWHSRKQLEKMGLSLEINEKGEYSFYKRDGYNRKKMGVYNITTKHKYGKDITYPAVVVYHGRSINEHGKVVYKQEVILAHVFVWLWFNDTLESNVDVDHIDNDKTNYNIENLQLLTRKANLKKRGVGRNQYSYAKTDEEIKKMREDKLALKFAKMKAREEKIKQKELEIANKKEFRELWSKYKADKITDEESERLIELLKQSIK